MNGEIFNNLFFLSSLIVGQYKLMRNRERWRERERKREEEREREKESLFHSLVFTFSWNEAFTSSNTLENPTFQT